ncbi:MAG TPA: N-acetyl sugar amidotransferase [Syntrophales bacterium]|nr:N-acetyl sugar amidotransferase [Syntrophales bacterium]
MKCVTPDTRPNIRIDESGLCSACANFGAKAKIDWDAREKALRELIADIKQRDSGGYDCIIPVSGGKDSTWQVIKCLEYGLKILAYTWRAPGRTDIGQANLDNLIGLGVDHIDISVSPEVEKRFTMAAFRKFGSNAIPMHFGIYSTPLRLAAQMGIPLVIYGENSAFEYGNPDDAKVGCRIDENWLDKYGVTHGTVVSDWVGVDGLSMQDLQAYSAPSLDRVEKAGVRAIFLGYYLPWDVETSRKAAAAHGFKFRPGKARTGYYDYADIDDDFISIHHWIKWYKFGFTRSFDNLSLEIRNGRISRDDAVTWLRGRGYERPSHDILKFCDWADISEEEFDSICESFRNREIWTHDGSKWKIPDYIVKEFDWQ